MDEDEKEQERVDKIDKKILSDYIVPIVVSIFTTLIVLTLIGIPLLTK
ncbi:MAG: hypothetical protein ABF975_01225 [Liquorilactobacillus hordei]